MLKTTQQVAHTKGGQRFKKVLMASLNAVEFIHFLVEAWYSVEMGVLHLVFGTSRHHVRSQIVGKDYHRTDRCSQDNISVACGDRDSRRHFVEMIFHELRRLKREREKGKILICVLVSNLPVRVVTAPIPIFVRFSRRFYA